MSNFVTPCTPCTHVPCTHQAFLSFTISQDLLKLMSIESVIYPTISSSITPFSFCFQSFPASGSFPMSLLFAPGGQSIGGSASASSPFSEYSVLISFRIDWFHLLAVQGILKSLLQHHSLKVSILWHSAFFLVQLSHPYMTTGKTIAFTIWTFVGKVCFVTHVCLELLGCKVTLTLQDIAKFLSEICSSIRHM